MLLQGQEILVFFLKKGKKSTQGFARNMGLMIYEGEVNIYTICIEYVPKKPILNVKVWNPEARG